MFLLIIPNENGSPVTESGCLCVITLQVPLCSQIGQMFGFTKAIDILSQEQEDR